MSKAEPPASPSVVSQELATEFQKCCRFAQALPPTPEPVAALVFHRTGIDIPRCPVCCAGRLRRVAVLRAGRIPAPALDTS